MMYLHNPHVGVQNQAGSPFTFTSHSEPKDCFAKNEKVMEMRLHLTILNHTDFDPPSLATKENRQIDSCCKGYLQDEY